MRAQRATKWITRSRLSMMGMTLGFEPRSLALNMRAGGHRPYDAPHREVPRKRAIHCTTSLLLYLGTAFNTGLPFFVRLFAFAAFRSSIASSSFSA